MGLADLCCKVGGVTNRWVVDSGEGTWGKEAGWLGRVSGRGGKRIDQSRSMHRGSSNKSVKQHVWNDYVNAYDLLEKYNLCCAHKTD